jgi:electron transfer flavoprotein alpha/beta subunit
LDETADCVQLRAALAAGADRALHAQTNAVIESFAAARVFLKLIEREQPFVVILGKQAIDNDNSQTAADARGPMGASSGDLCFEDELGDGKATVTRAVDAGYPPNDLQVGQTGTIIQGDPACPKKTIDTRKAAARWQ